MFDDLKIRNKLVLLVAGPMLIVLLLAGLGAQSRNRTAEQAKQVTTLVETTKDTSVVLDALQSESIFSSAHVASGREAWGSELETARAATDRAVEAIKPRLDGELQDRSSGVATTAAMASTALDRLDAVRAVVDDGYTWQQSVDAYRTMEESFLRLDGEITSAISDSGVSAKLRTLNTLEALKHATAEQGALLIGASTSGEFGPSGFDAYQAAISREDDQDAILSTVADNITKSQIRDAKAGPASARLQTLRAAAIGAGAEGAVSLDAETVASNFDERLDAYHEVMTAALQEQSDTAGARSSDERRSATLFLLAALVSVVLAGGAAVVLGRRITRPLNKLTVAADRLSSEQMPMLVESLQNPSLEEVDLRLSYLEEIEVDSKDEIGRLAAAFNDVQRVTGEVAAEQAATLRKGIGEMFVNLARRNQALLDRQIEFIDELERTEEDPDQLENLYKLDHMATRMRRNAESLLVLASAEPPRRRGRPAPFANVVRAALAEVEDFGRIELVSLDEVFIASTAASDVAHLLSELMENAANFSPPDTKVEIVGNRTKADGYVISITDHGIGMSATQIDDANNLLTRPPHVGLALSRSLGFIVVGRLALRHGISVRLMPASGGGVTALVTLPSALVTDGPSAPRSPRTVRAVAPNDRTARLQPKATTTTSKPKADVPPAVSFAPPAGSSDGAPRRSGSTDGPTSVPNRPAVEAARPAPAARKSDQPASGGSPAPITFDPGPATGPRQTRKTTESEGPAPLTAGGLPSRRLVSAPAPGRETPRRTLDGAPSARDLGRTPIESPPEQDPVESADIPPVERTSAETQEPVGSTSNFLEESQPPRLFGGQSDANRVKPPATPRRLFGTDPAGTPVPLPPSAEVAVATEPVTSNGVTATDAPEPPSTDVTQDLPEELPGTVTSSSTASEPNPAVSTPPSDPSVVTARTSTLPSRSSRTPTAASTEGGAAAPLPTRTPSGLARRTPRGAGSSRPMPGADGERGVGASKRSPEEVRNLLSRYRDGRQRAQSEPVPDAGPEEDR